MAPISRKGCLFVVLAALLFAVNAMAQATPRFEMAPLNPEHFTATGEPFGFIPPPLDLSHIGVPSRMQILQVLPAAWDWREHNGVTPVVSQGPYGSCWAFAVIADLESKVLINESVIYDLSESQVLSCNNWPWVTCNSGGHHFIAVNALTIGPSLEESCDPYACPQVDCNPNDCPGLHRVTEWQLAPNDVNAIKEAVYDHGPVYTTMYASFSGFSSYDGSYVIDYDGDEGPNHAVLIVGWDDDLGSAGAWIVKNSWGDDWGAEGFFYIEYGAAGIGSHSSVVTAYKAHAINEQYHFYDDQGWQTSVGAGNDYLWGLVRITPAGDGLLAHVDFWAVATDTAYEIEIYDDFDGANLGNLLGSKSGSAPQAGYYSIELDSPIAVTDGDEFAIKMKITTPGFHYPVPASYHEPIDYGKTYLSVDGSNWKDAGDYGWDVGIRARIKTCIDNDGDGYGEGCALGPDCDDDNPNVWESCDTCADNDGDGWWAGCDAYVTIAGPDHCDDDPNNWTAAGCANCADNDGDGWWAGCDAYVTIAGPDHCDDDPDNWTAAGCANCVDADGDGWFVGCDRYHTIAGPDCNDANPFTWDTCKSCKDDDGDGWFEHCNRYFAEFEMLTIGTGTEDWEYPLAALYQDSRTQTIYLASELGARAGQITSLALEVTAIPGQTMNNFTIRMKHTSLGAYSVNSWEGPASGWTIVYQNDKSITETGWITFELTAPFDYNGVDNLMVDISFNNSSWTSDGYVRYTSTGENRSLYFRTDGVYGDPLDWTGTSNPVPNAIARLPDLRLTFENVAIKGPDCNDNHPDVYPGAPELCDGIDNQCPGDPGYGIIDEGCYDGKKKKSGKKKSGCGACMIAAETKISPDSIVSLALLAIPFAVTVILKRGRKKSRRR